MSNKLTGVVYSVGATQTVSEKFSKREIIIEDTSGKYPQHIAIQFTQDKCDDLNSIAPGQEVEVSYNLTGRLWLDPKTEAEKCFYPHFPFSAIAHLCNTMLSGIENPKHYKPLPAN